MVLKDRHSEKKLFHNFEEQLQNVNAVKSVSLDLS